MTRLNMVQPEQASGEVKKWFDAAQEKYKMAPNLLKVMANSPVVLRAYMNFNSALAEGKLPHELRERICVAVAYFDRCHY